MSDLSSIERRKLEQLFGMGSGYVLNFSDRTFAEFFKEQAGLDIDQDKYRARGTSKANRLRTFWTVEPNHLVGKVVGALIEYGTELTCLPNDPTLLDAGRRIIVRLNQGSAVAELEALTATIDARDFETVAKQVQEAILNPSLTSLETHCAPSIGYVA